MKSKILPCIILLLLFITFIAITINSYASSISNDLKSNFFRLHILANSNSIKDQELKLKVRDGILAYMKEISYNDLSKDEAISLTKNNIESFQKIAEKVIEDEGFSYPVKVEIGNFYFPTKHYGNISLPAGYYDGLKIEIGTGNGNNWWCTLFPPLCFVDISSGVIDEEAEENLKENLSGEDFAIITSNSCSVKLKFKLLEVLSK